MTPVVTKVVFFTSSALGALTLGSTAYLVKHPTAFAPEPARPLAVTAITARPAPPTPVVLPETIVLEPVTITGSRAPVIRTKASPARHRTEPAKPTELNPCTGWREMGPKNIDKGNETGARKVRTLC